MSTALTAAGTLTALAEQINGEHRQCEEAIGAAVQHAIHAGELLAEAKALCRHGEWLAWLDDTFEGSERTAQAYMRVAREWPKLTDGDPQRVADLSYREAVRLLAAPREASAPENVMVETLAGVTIRPGHLVLGHLDYNGERHIVSVEPWAHDPTFFHLAVISTQTVIAGTRRPVRLGYLGACLAAMMPPALVDHIAWDGEPTPCEGTAYNEWLFKDDPAQALREMVGAA